MTNILQPKFEAALEATGEYGVVGEMRESLVLASGLPGASIDEVVVFSENQVGYVFSLAREMVEIVVLSDEPVQLGSKVARTGRRLSIPVSEGLRGGIIDPLGRPLLTPTVAGAFSSEERPLDADPPHIGQRRKITRHLPTGMSLVDLMLPLGYGQRQVVLGDQKTGKTSLLMLALQLFAARGVVVYAAIGKPLSVLAQDRSLIEQMEGRENVVMIASSAADMPSLIVLTPLAAMTVAEYFRDLGRDVMLVLDDLSTHARFYREIALLGRRFPGRESYPGDMFHLHARLLERAGNFVRAGDKEVSITCLPVAETVSSDLTGYIVSNLISITDGHFLFDSKLFNQGQRPAINTRLSVTRVGRQTQDEVGKQLHEKLGRLLDHHQKATQHAHFGAELNEEMAAALDAGNKLLAFFAQPTYLAVPRSVQVVLATVIWQGWLTGQPDEVAGQWRDRLVQQHDSAESVRAMLDNIVKTKDLNQLIERLHKQRETLTTLCQSEKISTKK
jgi:F-type H+/Na+-transporting ATPase subunit alpha